MEDKLNIAKLENVGLREIWPDEARDLTPWLASEDGLNRLGETLGFHLECIGTEKPVGPFFADILARVATDQDHRIVIENQLGKTDHDHLGKAITYAAGLGAKTVVWVAPHFTEEHRQALDWLNEHAGEHISFWGLEIRAFRIDGSRPAPQFVIISSPNLTIKQVRETVQAAERKSADEIMAIAAKNDVGELTEKVLTLSAPENQFVWAEPSRVHGGSFRCWRKEPGGKERVVLGINVSGAYKHSPRGQLDLWLPIPTLASVAEISLSDVQHALESLPVYQKGNCDWIVRLASQTDAERTVKAIMELFVDHPGYYANAED